MRRTANITIIGLALLGLVGCSSSGTDVINPQSTTEESVAAVSTTVGAGVGAFTVANLFAADAVPTPRGGCAPLDTICTSGSAQVCFNATTDVTLTDCVNDGNLLSGAISLTDGGANRTVTYDVIVNGVSVSGSVLTHYDGTCVTQTISTLAMAGSAVSSAADGALIFCNGDMWPRGTLNVAAQGPVASWLLEFTYDATEVAAVMITEESTGLSTTCSVNLASGGADCSLPG